MEVLQLKLANKSCENPFLVSFSFWKWKVTQGFQLRLESTQKLRSRGGHACSRLGKTTIEKQLVNKESFNNIISITPPHFLGLLGFYVCSHWIWSNSCINKFNFFTHLKATHYQITCGLVKNKENKKYTSKLTNKQEANKQNKTTNKEDNIKMNNWQTNKPTTHTQTNKKRQQTKN